jgi:hypothetical protein
MQAKQDDFFSSQAFLQALALYEEQEMGRLDAELAEAGQQEGSEVHDAAASGSGGVRKPG